MKPCYINGVGCISAQKTFNNAAFLEEAILQNANILSIVPPNYKDYISRSVSRRMAKGVKMGVVAATIAMKEAGVVQPDAILTGSGMGCVRDSEKFLESILDNDEQHLTPTAFIQSTHNTVGAQIALGLKCPSYNLTYVHGAVSFESALIDALLLFKEAAQNSDSKISVLVGGIEELGDHTTRLFQLIHHIKTEKPNTLELLDCRSKGTIFSEGAQFFLLSEQQQSTTYARLGDVEIIGQLAQQHLAERLVLFLKKNGLILQDIDLVLLGNNGDIEFDHFYQRLQNGIFKNIPQAYYKHLCGEYNTASAFGFWTAAQILKAQQIPNVLRLNDLSPNRYQRVVLYNQYRGKNHSFVLMEKA